MNDIEYVLNKCEKKRDKVIKGGINSIPSPFKRFRSDFLGIQQGKIYNVTAATKGAKTSLASYLFVYQSILYAYYNPDKIRVKIFYFHTEESKEVIIKRFLVYLLFEFSGNSHNILDKVDPIIVTSTELSSDNNIAIDKKYLDMLKNEEPFKSILKFFSDHVEFNDSRKCRDAWFTCQKYAAEHGKVYKTPYTYFDELGVETTGEKFDRYEQDDDDEYRILFYDNVNNIESDTGENLYSAIHKYSAKYCIRLRDRYNFTICNIQQQNKDSDGLDAYKANKLRPSVNDMADCKATMNDVNTGLGIFNPIRYELDKYKGYDITQFRDNIRFFEVLINRDGCSNGLIALFYLGECNYWCELPLPDDKAAIQKWYQLLQRIRQRNIPQNIDSNQSNS